MSQRVFTHEEACAALGAIRACTLAANERLEALRVLAGQAEKDDEAAIERQMNAVLSNWAGEIIALGALPKGIFTVDFDSGRGFFYCWSLNEPTLSHYHDYEEGFAGRKPLSAEQVSEAPVVLN